MKAAAGTVHADTPEASDPCTRCLWRLSERLTETRVATGELSVLGQTAIVSLAAIVHPPGPMASDQLDIA